MGTGEAMSDYNQITVADVMRAAERAKELQRSIYLKRKRQGEWSGATHAATIAMEHIEAYKSLLIMTRNHSGTEYHQLEIWWNEILDTWI
jgi:hypothetical protein